MTIRFRNMHAGGARHESLFSTNISCSLQFKHSSIRSFCSVIIRKCTKMRSYFKSDQIWKDKGAKNGIMQAADEKVCKVSKVCKVCKVCNQNAINRGNSWVARRVKGWEPGSSLHRGLVSGLWDVLEHTNTSKGKLKMHQKLQRGRV